jgi:adenylate cyclase
MQARRLLITVSLLIAAIWGWTLGYLHMREGTDFLERTEASLADLRSQVLGTSTPPSIVSIIAIDDQTAAANGYPLKRVVLARLLEEISALKPKVVSLDILLVDAGPESGDAALANSLRQVPSVIAAAGVFPKSIQSVTPDPDDPLATIPVASEMLLPNARFADAAAIGVVNVSTDQTGTPRYIPLISRGAGRVDSSFPLRVASMALGTNPAFTPAALTLGERRIPTDAGQRLPLTFYGPRGTIPTISALDVLAGKLDAKAVEGRVIVIGSTVTGGGDVFPTPFDAVLPGVEVMSTAITRLISGDAIVRDNHIRSFDAVLSVALPLLVIALLGWRRSAVAYGAIAAVALVWVSFNVIAFSYGYWFSAALPIAATLPPVLLFGAMEIWHDRRRATHFAAQSALLQRIEAPGLGEWLARDPSFLSRPVRQEAAVVFVDLSGFTGLSEAIGPANVQTILSGFFELVDDEARAHGGAITSFMGDGAMILFGLPQPTAEDAVHATACAVALCDRLRGWLAHHPMLKDCRIGFKVGAHCGTVVASRLGTGVRQQITATGDTVNVASRLMEVAAARGAELALSAALVLAIGPSAELLLGDHLTGPVSAAIRGRAESVDVWLWQGHPL